jgi:hypothetical protein
VQADLEYTSAAADPKCWDVVQPLVNKLLGDQESTLCAKSINVFGMQVNQNRYLSLPQNAATPKDKWCILPKPVVVRILVNGQPVQALLNSGLLSDFMSTTLADQLKVKKDPLDSPMVLQLVVQGLHSKVKSRTSVNLKYQNIDEDHLFDIIKHQ